MHVPSIATRSLATTTLAAMLACSSPTSPSADAGAASDALATTDRVASQDGTGPMDAAPADARPGGAHPNFIVILSEASGWTSTSVLEDNAIPASRSGTIQTPSLDRLAGGGMRFSDFYAPSPRCMPTRAALFSGVSPAALHMTFVPETHTDGSAAGTVIAPTPITTLPPSTPTVASILRGVGYATAHFGKWHAGNVDPMMYGFDLSDGPTSNRGPDNVDHPNPTQAYALTDRALAFMGTQAAAGRPFYLQVSTYGGKDQVDSRPETYAAVAARLPGRSAIDIATAAVQADMDANIGRILARVDELGLAGTTYIVFTSDHGAQGTNANLPLAEGKGTVWEGGIRVPLFVRGPGIAAGVATRVRATGVDLLPTLASLAGASSLPSNLEGGSLVQLLTGASMVVARPREEFVVHFPHYDHDPLGPASSILFGDYKLTRFYETGALHLFNVATDFAEATDLASSDPARVMDLDRRLTEYLTAVNAQMPTRP